MPACILLITAHSVYGSTNERSQDHSNGGKTCFFYLGHVCPMITCMLRCCVVSVSTFSPFGSRSSNSMSVRVCLSTFSPFGSRSSNSMRVCVCVCVRVCLSTFSPFGLRSSNSMSVCVCLWTE